MNYYTSIDLLMNIRFSERDKFLCLRANAETKKSDQTVRYGIELNSAVEGTEQLMQRDKGNKQFFLKCPRH